jgi:hypothetical protein
VQVGASQSFDMSNQTSDTTQRLPGVVPLLNAAATSAGAAHPSAYPGPSLQPNLQQSQILSQTSYSPLMPTSQVSAAPQGAFGAPAAEAATLNPEERKAGPAMAGSSAATKQVRRCPD